MLYVAGEILLWMLLALALGILAGWVIWGLRARTDEERIAAEHHEQLGALREEAGRLQAQNQDLLATHARDAAMIAHLQQSAGGDSAPLVARIRELEGELQRTTREGDLLRQRLFELEQAQAHAAAGAPGEVGAEAGDRGDRAAEGGGPPTAPVAATAAGAGAATAAAADDAERQRLQRELDELRTRFNELGRAFGGQLDLGDPAAVRVRWSAMHARAAESDQLARQLDGLRAVLGGQLDPAELQERFTDLEHRASEADALRARLAQLEGPEGVHETQPIPEQGGDGRQ